MSNNNMNESDNDKKTTTELEWSMDKVRTTFVKFFVDKHNHTYWPSSPCVPIDDPTLLFANAGMNQYKPLFLGTCDPHLSMAQLKRACNSQKCIRAGGKHNDLDDVGKDVYHHTFFEMLGNWSFGDYFKNDAINMAWCCLVDEFQLDPNRLYATYFAGDDMTPCDNEAKQIWLKYLPEERVLPFDAKDNFWEMGSTGPCGPCTEIHYDRIGGGRDASKLVNADLPDVIEIWNNVFIQYNRESDGSLRQLPQQHVDTGMGFERLTSILQNVDSNYDTDIFIPIFTAIQKITGVRPYAGKVGMDDTDNIDMSYRVIADHIRTLCFAITDGAIPSNDGRGYVLRLVLRRAVRYGRQNLNAGLGFFSKLVPTVIDLMGKTYPELVEKQDLVTSIIRDEEESFSRTLDNGLKKFNDMAEQNVGEDKVFSGKDAHFLYTTMGFPVDLTIVMCEEKGLSLDRDEFDEYMRIEGEISRGGGKTGGGLGKDMRLVAEQTAYLVGENVSATDDEPKYVWNKNLEGCAVKALFIGRNETEDMIGFVPSVSPESGAVGIVLDKTSFYAEAGGQVYDTGVIRTSSGATIKIENVQAYGQFVLHVGKVESGTVTVNDTATCSVDYIRRQPIASNHTMTHVLNYALRQVLIVQPEAATGKKSTYSIDQKGSLVDESKLRFDFSWKGSLTSEQLAAVEALCNDRIERQVPVDAYVAPLGDAGKISSLRAVFGEKYPDPVRVVAVSDHAIPEMLANPQDSQWNEYSVEFCGGTHLTNTKEAEAFVLLSEDGIAKGIRRIVAVTMADAKEAIQAAEIFQAKLHIASTLAGDELEAQVKTLSRELEELQIAALKKVEFRDMLSNFAKQVNAYKKEKIANMADIVDMAVKEAGSSDSNKVVVRFDFGTDGKLAKKITQAFGKRVKDKAVMLVSADKDANKCLVFAVAPKQMEGLDCKAWATAAVEGMDAKGGGKKDSANFIFSGAANADKVVEAAKAM